MTLQVKPGDYVAVTRFDHREKAVVPIRLAKVYKVTAKRIYINSDTFYDFEGKPQSRYTHGVLTDDPDAIASLQAIAKQKQEEQQEMERQRREHQAKASYQLTQIRESVWEKLGEEYLAKILKDLEAK